VLHLKTQTNYFEFWEANDMGLPDQLELHPTEQLDSDAMNKDQRLYTQAASALAERRKSPRTAIHRPAYINFEPYNRGGVITDISETGLRFHTVDTLEQGGIVRVSIFLGAAGHIEVVGELMWKDATQRIGGLRFTVLPAGAADQIRVWAEASNGAEVSGADISGMPPLPAENREAPASNLASSRSDAAPVANNGASERASQAELPDLPQTTQAQAPDRNTNTQSPWVPRSMRPASQAPNGQKRSHDLSNAGALPPGQPWVPPAAYQQPDAMPWITHFDPDPPASRSLFVRGLLGGIIICVVLGFVAWFGLPHNLWQNISIPLLHRDVSAPAASSPAVPATSPSADLPKDPASDVSTTNSRPSEQSQAAPSPAASSSAGADMQTKDLQANSQPNPNPSGPQPQSHHTADSTATVSPETPAAPAAAPPQTIVAQAPSVVTPSSPALSAARDPLPAAAQPARAPDAGESQLTLARQYLDGRGHPRNPAAASQLLWSAVEKGNSAAETDLADLYLRGDGVSKNCDQARVLLSAASGKGNAEAMQKLTELNRSGCR
jgi:hypothetical protein